MGGFAIDMYRIFGVLVEWLLIACLVYLIILTDIKFICTVYLHYCSSALVFASRPMGSEIWKERCDVGV